MTSKPDSVGDTAAPALDGAGTATVGLFDFGTPAGTRKRLFQFARPGLAKRNRKTALGPTRSEFGCD